MGLFDKAVSSLGGILGGRKTNAYQAPDLSFLKDTSGFDYLKKPTGGYFYGDADSMFKDYLSSINNPEQYGAENDYLKQIMDEINQSTNESLGSSRMDYADRGLSGPGQTSDIESIGLAKIREGGDKLKSSAATQLMLDRAKRLSGAYETRYGAGVNADTQKRSIEDANAQLFANLLNQRDLTRASGGLQAASDYAKNQVNTPGLFETMLRNFGNTFATAEGQKFGSGKMI